MVPNVEEVRRELEVLVFGYTEILADGNVPVLLKRTAERISPEVSEAGGAINTDRRRTADGSRIEELIDPAVNISMGLRGADGEARMERCCAGVRAAQRKGRASGSIDHDERCSRLEGCDSAERPASKKSTDHAFALCQERQVPVVVNDQPVGTIKIRGPVGTPQVGLIVDRRVKCGVAAGCRIQRLRPGIGRLEVERPREPVSRRNLQRVVVRPRIACEQLVVARCQAKRSRARIGIGECVFRDGVLRAILCLDRHRVSSRIVGLNSISSLTQVCPLGADVANFQNPVPRQFALDAQVPLLRAG